MLDFLWLTANKKVVTEEGGIVNNKRKLMQFGLPRNLCFYYLFQLQPFICFYNLHCSELRPKHKKKREYLITWMTVLMMFADRQEEQMVQTSAPTVIDGGVWRSGGTGLRSGLQLAGERQWWLGGSGRTGTLLRTISLFAWSYLAYKLN